MINNKMSDSTLLPCMCTDPTPRPQPLPEWAELWWERGSWRGHQPAPLTNQAGDKLTSRRKKPPKESAHVKLSGPSNQSLNCTSFCFVKFQTVFFPTRTHFYCCEFLTTAVDTECQGERCQLDFKGLTFYVSFTAVYKQDLHI